MSRPRKESPRPTGRPGKGDAAGKPEESGVGSRPDYHGQDKEGGMPTPEYDIYREVPGERVGG